MIKINIQNVIIVALTLVIIMLLFDKCKSNEEFRALQMKFDSDVTHIKDSLGEVIAVQEVEIVKNEQSMTDLRARLFETTERYNQRVKEVSALIASKTVVVYKEKKVPYLDTGTMKKWNDSIAKICKDVIKYYEDSTVKVGTIASDSSAYYNFKATIQKRNLDINKIQFIDSQYVSITKLKGGFFRKNYKGKFKIYSAPRTVVEIKHTNPYFQNTGINSYVLDKTPKPNYGTGVVHGALVGVLLTILTFLSL